MSPQRPTVEPHCGPRALYPAARCEFMEFPDHAPGWVVMTIHEHRADDMILSVRRAYERGIVQGLGERAVWEFVRSEFLAFWEECYGS